MGIFTKSSDLEIIFHIDSHMSCYISHKFGKNAQTQPRQTIILEESVATIVEAFILNEKNSEIVEGMKKLFTIFIDKETHEFLALMERTEATISTFMSDAERTELAEYVKSGGVYPSLLVGKKQREVRLTFSYKLVNVGAPRWKPTIDLPTIMPTSLVLARLPVLVWWYVFDFLDDGAKERLDFKIWQLCS